MSETELKPGDRVYHLSLTSVVWVIEKLEESFAYCSTLQKDTLELKHAKFSITSIRKIVERTTTLLPKTRRGNNYF